MWPASMRSLTLPMYSALHLALLLAVDVAEPGGVCRLAIIDFVRPSVAVPVDEADLRRPDCPPIRRRSGAEALDASTTRSGAVKLAVRGVEDAASGRSSARRVCKRS